MTSTPAATVEAAVSEAVTDSAAARSAAPAEEPAEEPAETTEQAVAEPAVEAAASEEADEGEEEPGAEPTPEAVALVAPEGITSSEVVANVQRDDAVAVTNYGVDLPVLWIAQGSALLLTVVLGSLWWRSRMSRRPRA
jgi:hypothetical protein